MMNNFENSFMLAQRSGDPTMGISEQNEGTNSGENQTQQNPATETQQDELTAVRENVKNLTTDYGKLQTRVETVEKNFDSPFDSTIGIISVVSVLVALIAVIVAVFAKITANNAVKRLNDNSSKKSKLESELSKKISELENEIAELKSRSERSVEARNTPVAPVTSMPYPSEKNFAPPPAPTEYDMLKKFVEDFNALSSRSGFSARQAVSEFLQTYPIKSFNCANFESRVDEPIPDPIFETAAQTQKADYWAYEFKPGVYAVVPNVKNYTDNHHAARAMGDVFDSNFVEGRTYGKIRVIKPATFKGMWELAQRGKLELG